MWDWLDQKYLYRNFKWSANKITITLDMEETENYGGGNSIRYYNLTSNCLILYYSDGDLDGTYYKK